MSKRTLIVIVVIGLLIIIAGAIFLLRSGQESPQGETEPQNLVTVSPPTETGGWRLIRHPVFGITFRLPPGWEIRLFEDGRGRIEGVFFGEGINAIVNIDRQDNTERLTPEKLLSQIQSFPASEISRGTVKGVSYVTKAGSEDTPELIGESYVLINKYFIDDRILDISCSLSGPNYRTMIPTCEKITESLQFIQ